MPYCVLHTFWHPFARRPAPLNANKDHPQNQQYRRRYTEKFSTWDIIRKYNKDYKLLFIGDATMGPYEILQPGGSVEYSNEETGAVWLQRLTNAFPKIAWINPEPQGLWEYRQSISIVQQLVGQRMFPLTLKGLEETMRLLSK